MKNLMILNFKWDSKKGCWVPYPENEEDFRSLPNSTVFNLAYMFVKLFTNKEYDVTVSVRKGKP